jgi:RNA polymerase sigma factor (sigma-70 family)
MPTIATSSPDEPDDEDRERQELRRLLSECMERLLSGTPPSDAFRPIEGWLVEPTEESERTRRMRLLADELKGAPDPRANQLRRKQRRHSRGVISEQIEWTKDDEALGSEDVARVSDALSNLASLHPRIAETARLRFIAGLSLSEIATRIGVAETEVRKHATFARAWLLRELNLHAADPDDREPPAQKSEDMQRKLERMLTENYADMRAFAEGLLRSARGTDPPMGQISPTELLHEVYLRLASDPRLDAEDRTMFLRLFIQTSHRVLLDFRRARESRKGHPIAQASLDGSLGGGAPDSEGGMLKRAWRGVVRSFRAVFRRD